MDLVRRRRNDTQAPERRINRLQDDINRLFDLDWFGRTPSLFEGEISPSMDVEETENDIIVHCDLPGVQKDDIDISLSDNNLTIKGEKKGEEEKKDSQYYRKESWSGSFQRTIALPNTVDPSKTNAELKNGVLKVTLPKKEEAKPKQISVNVK